MTTAALGLPGPAAADRAAELAAAVLAHPAVARLDAGPFGSVASYLPRRRVVGVRIGSAGEPVELAVVARLGLPLLQLADELAAVARGLLGPVAVEVTVSDVVAAVGLVTGGRTAADGAAEPLA